MMVVSASGMAAAARLLHPPKAHAGIVHNTIGVPDQQGGAP